MKIYIIRHAEKESGNYYNPRLRHQDWPITAKGQTQAERLGDFFAERPVAALYVSGYLRTQQTAAPLADRLGLVPIIDERLNEIDNGLLEGLTEREVQTRFPDVWQAVQARSADFRFPGGETGEEVQARISSLLEERRHSGKDTILITHEGLIRLTMCHVMGLPVYDRWNFAVDYCGIMEIVAIEDRKGWKLIRFNQLCL